MRACCFVLAFAACAGSSAPQPSTTPSSVAPPAPKAPDHDREAIEKAYAAKDTNALHELLDIVVGKANHALARDLYVKLQLEALVALDCTHFFAAFGPVHGKPNPRTAFAALTPELDPEQKQYVAATVLDTAARCKSPLILTDSFHYLVPDSEDAWAAALVAIDKKGVPVYDVFMSALLASTKHLDGKLIAKWLIATKEPIHCHELSTASKAAEAEVRAGLAEFYAQKGCKAELSASR
jgi:hypothetical protein